MALKLEDLPPAMRKQVEAKAKPKSRKQAPGRVYGVCVACGERFGMAAWERHIVAEHDGHGRYEILSEVA